MLEGIYGQQEAAAKQAYQLALASINQRRNSMINQFGFSAKVDKTGHLKKYKIDPNNPYGAVQAMKRGQSSDLARSFSETYMRGLGGMPGRGGQPVGLGAQQEQQLRFGHGAEEQELGRGFTEGIGELGNQQASSLAQYQMQLLSIKQAKLMAALAEASRAPMWAPTSEPAPTAPTVRFDDVRPDATMASSLRTPTFRFGGGPTGVYTPPKRKLTAPIKRTPTFRFGGGPGGVYARSF